MGVSTESARREDGTDVLIDYLIRAHVKKDLFPYICVFEDCDEPYQLYATSEEWSSHMSSQHRIRWYCSANSHPLFSTDTRNDFNIFKRRILEGFERHSFPSSLITAVAL